MAKAKHTDQTYCGTPRDTVGPVELKLGSLGRVHGIVVGAFGEASDDLHSLIHHLAVSRVRFAGLQGGRRGQVRTEEAEIALTISLLRKSLFVWAVIPQQTMRRTIDINIVVIMDQSRLNFCYIFRNVQLVPKIKYQI